MQWNSTSVAGHCPSESSTAPRCRARAASRRATSGRTERDSVTTRSTPSINAPITAAYSAPGRGTNASRETTTPCSAAATIPSDGTPTTAAHAPATVASASNANSNEVE